MLSGVYAGVIFLSHLSNFLIIPSLSGSFSNRFQVGQAPL